MQINRLFKIIYILLNKQQVTAKELASQFEVSTRTIYRDVETLSGAGIPIYMSQGKGGGISLLPDYILNKAVITEQEKTDLLSSLGAVGAVSLEDMQETLDKFRSLFGSNSTDWIEVDFGFWSDGEKETDLFQKIKTSILQWQVVQFYYMNVKGESLLREVEPIKLVFKGSAWYLYGYCRLRKDYRFFKLKRIRNLVVLKEQFKPHPVRQVLQDAEYREQDKHIKVKMKIAKELAFRGYDEFAYCEVQPDGSIIAETYMPDEDWLANFLLSYGEMCEIIEPQELRGKMKEKLTKLLKQYANTPT